MVFQSRIPEFGQLSFSEDGGFNLDHKASQPKWPLKPKAETFISKALNPKATVFVPRAVMPQPLSPLATIFRPQSSIMTRLNPQAQEFTPTQSPSTALSPLAAVFRPHSAVTMRLNPETNEHTPIQSPSTVLSPLAGEFVPSWSTISDTSSLTVNSSLNAEAMAFSQPPQAAISSSSHPYYDGCLNDQPSLSPLVALADGVADTSYEEKFRDLAIEAYMDVEFHGLGFGNEDLPEVVDDDFETAAELEAALTRPAPEHFLIPCMSLLPSGIIEMPLLFAGSILSTSLSIREVNRSLCMPRGPMVRIFLANIEMPLEFPSFEPPVYDIRIFNLPDEHIRFPGRSWDKEKFICPKSAMYQSESIIYDVPKIDASLKALRELEGYNDWSDDTDADEWGSSAPLEPQPRLIFQPQALPDASVGCLRLASGHRRPSEEGEKKKEVPLFQKCLNAAALKVFAGPPIIETVVDKVVKHVVEDVGDPLERLRAFPSLHKWSDDVDDEEDEALVTTAPPLQQASSTVDATLEPIVVPSVDTSPSQHVAALIEELSAIVQTSVEQDDDQDAARAVEKVSVPSFNEQDMSFDIFKLPAQIDEPSNTESPRLSFEVPVTTDQSLQGRFTEMLMDIAPTKNTTESIITDCLVQPLAICKSSSPSLVQSTLPSSLLEGVEIVTDDTKLEASFSDYDSVFDNDTDDHVDRFDIDIHPEARSSTPTPSVSSSEDELELEESIEKAETISPIALKQLYGEFNKDYSTIKENAMAPSPTPSLPVAIQHDAESTDTLSTIRLPSPPSPLVLPFRPELLRGFNDPSSSKKSKHEQLPSFPGCPVVKPGTSRIPRSRGFYPGSKKFRDVYALDLASNSLDKELRKSSSATPPSGSKLPKPVQQQLSPPLQPSRKRHARFDKNRTSPLRQMQTIDEESESVPENAILNTPEVVIEDLKDLGRRFQVKLAEAANSKSELSRLIDEDRALPPRSLIPVSASTSPATPPSQSRRAVGGQYDPGVSLSPESENSSPFKRPESNTPTRMSRNDDLEGFTDFEEDSSDYVHGKAGLSTIFEESYLSADVLPATPQLLPTHSKELVDPRSLESSDSTLVLNNEQQQQANEPLSIIEGQSPFRLPGKMHKDRITSGAWLGSAAPLQGTTSPEVVSFKDVAGPAIPPRSSSLLAFTNTRNLQPLPATPTTTTKMLGLNITTPPCSTSSSTHRLLSALAAATLTSTYHPDFEFFDATHPAANEASFTPTGFKTGIRGTPSVLKTWNSVFTAEGRLRSPAQVGKYHLRIIRSSRDHEHQQSAEAGEQNSIASPSPADLLMTRAVGVGEMSTTSLLRASDVAFEAMGRSRKPSRINRWYNKGIERKLVKKQPMHQGKDKVSVVRNGESAICESAPAVPAAAKKEDQKKGFFGKMKKMFGLRSGKKE